MPLSVPPELKKITTFVRRAEELDRDKSNPESRVVAYYSRQFAVQQGISLAKSPTGKQCLGGLLGDLEAEKAPMAVFSRDEARIICRRFADKIFGKADSEDRAGAADKGTARTFYAAAAFYEILQQFYEVTTEEGLKTDEQKEEDERRVYCKWKATEILKAIREGRKPAKGSYAEGGDADDGGDGVAGGETGSDDQGAHDAPDAFVPPPLPPPHPPIDYNDGGEDEGTEIGLSGAPHVPAPPPYNDASSDDGDGDVFVPGAVLSPSADDDPPPPVYQPPPAQAPSTLSPPMPAPSFKPPPAAGSSSKSSVSGSGLFGGFGKKGSSQTNGRGRVSKAALEDATELTRFALAALGEKDANLAADRLRQALKVLGR